MIKLLKRLYSDYKPIIKGVMTALGIIAIYDWVIAPGLTAQNTVVNIFSFIGGSVLILILGLLIWENLFKTDKKENTWHNHSEAPSETQESGKEEGENKNNNDNENLNNSN